MKIRLKPTIKQFEAWEALKTHKEVFLGGGAGGGKSWWLCETRLVNCYRYPGYKSFIGREELKRLMGSTYVTWLKVCKYHNIPPTDWKLNGQYNYIEFKNGSRIDLLDLKYLPSDPLFERFGSLEFTDGAIEEAGEIHFLAYDVLKSRIGRHLNRELSIKPTLALTANPKKNWLYRTFYKPWKTGTLPDNIAFIQSLYGDNPHTAEEYGEQLDGIKDRAIRQRLRDGIWDYDEDAGVLIPYDAISDMWSTIAEPSDDRYLTADIARFGSDSIIYGLWQGLHLYRIIIKKKQGTDTTAQQIDLIARHEKIPRSRIIVDEDGVGGGVVDILKGIKGFMANRTPLVEKQTQKELVQGTLKKRYIRPNYANLKAQCGWMLADALNERRIQVTCNNESVKEYIEEELAQIKNANPDDDRKLQLLPKDEVKENIGRSPDFSDMMLMRMFFEIKGQAGSPGVPEMTDIEKEFVKMSRMQSSGGLAKIKKL